MNFQKPLNVKKTAKHQNRSILFQTIKICQTSTTFIKNRFSVYRFEKFNLNFAPKIKENKIGQKQIELYQCGKTNSYSLEKCPRDARLRNALDFA